MKPMIRLYRLTGHIICKEQRSKARSTSLKKPLMYTVCLEKARTVFLIMPKMLIPSKRQIPRLEASEQHNLPIPPTAKLVVIDKLDCA